MIAIQDNDTHNSVYYSTIIIIIKTEQTKGISASVTTTRTYLLFYCHLFSKQEHVWNGNLRSDRLNCVVLPPSFTPLSKSRVEMFWSLL